MDQHGKKKPPKQTAGRGGGKKNQRERYKAENRDRKNRERRLWRTLREQPNNTQVMKALGIPVKEEV